MGACVRIEAAEGATSGMAHGRVEPITVLIPCYNHADFVADAIASVAAQDYPGVQLHVLDDGSTDASADVIRGALGRVSNMQCRFDRHSNRGVARTLNSMIERVGTDLVAILNADDWYTPDRLTRILSARRPGTTFLGFSGGEALNREDAVETEAFSAYQARLYAASDTFPTAGFALMACYLPVSSSNFVFSRDLFARSGGFHPDSVMSDDRDFLMRCLPHVEPVFVPEPLWGYRLHRANSWRSRQHLKTQALQDDWRRFAAAAEAGGANTLAPFPWIWPRYFRLFVRMVNRSIDDEPLATLLPRDWTTRTRWPDGCTGHAAPPEVEQAAIEALLHSCRRSGTDAVVTSPDLAALRARCAERWSAVRSGIP